MSVDVRAHEGGRILELHVTGKLTRADYERILPEVDDGLREHDRIDLLLALEEFRGWDAAAMWEDLKFDVDHFDDIRRLAVVGEERWHEGMSPFFKPFTAAEVRYFDPGQLEDARAWLAEE